MCSFTCVSVVACVARKLRLCPSYSRHRDRINLGLWRSLYKGGGGNLLVHRWVSIDRRFLHNGFCGCQMSGGCSLLCLANILAAYDTDTSTAVPTSSTTSNTTATAIVVEAMTSDSVLVGPTQPHGLQNGS